MIQRRLQPLLIQFLIEAKLADPDPISQIMKTSWCRWNGHDQGYGCITLRKKTNALPQLSISGTARHGTSLEEKERRSAMIAYVTIGTNNMERATKFYNALLAEVDPGIKVLMDAGRIKLWGKPGSPNLAVCTPFDGKGASVGNGVMVALAADSPTKVDAIYKKALELGGTDEGAPGRRGGDKGPYIGYFRDPDGNKLNAICMK
jgi:catechol 2,3-dioxygenase-like lactoylglutathione lyase family enzyme